MRDGAFGILRSVIPPVTAPASAALLTGTQPGKNGIYDFCGVDLDRLARTGVSYLGRSKVPTIVDLADLLGLSVGLFGIPTLYPVPKPRMGFAVAGFGVPSNAKIAEPESVLKRLEEEGYSPSGTRISASDPKAPERLSNEMSRRWEIFKNLWYDYETDIAYCWLPESDHASHYFWDDGTKLLPVYKTADEILRDAMRIIGQDDLLIVASDHGFTSIEASFFPNALLWRAGFLRLKRSPITLLRLAITRLVRWARKRSAALDAAAVMGAARRESLVVRMVRPFVLSHRDMDLKRTKAAAIGSPTEYSLIYLKRRIREKQDERERYLRQLESLFSEIPVVKEVLRGSDVYAGEALEEAPDLVVRLDDGVVSMTTNIPHTKRFLGGPPWSQFRGKHHRNGIVGIWGTGVQSGATLAAEIYDVLPTVLHALGYPIPDYSDGRPIVEAFETDSPLRREARVFSPLKLRARAVARSVKRRVLSRSKRPV